jgi:hypothetical protein
MEGISLKGHINDNFFHKMKFITGSTQLEFGSHAQRYICKHLYVDKLEQVRFWNYHVDTITTSLGRRRSAASTALGDEVLSKLIGVFRIGELKFYSKH